MKNTLNLTFNQHLCYQMNILVEIIITGQQFAKSNLHNYIICYNNYQFIPYHIIFIDFNQFSSYFITNIYTILIWQKTMLADNTSLSKFIHNKSRPISANSTAHPNTNNRVYKYNTHIINGKIFKNFNYSKENLNEDKLKQNKDNPSKKLSQTNNNHHQVLRQNNGDIRTQSEKKSVIIINIEEIRDEESQNNTQVASTLENNEAKELKQKKKRSRDSLHEQLSQMNSVLMNTEKILLPIKQYSNKFLRDRKIKAEIDELNHSIIRPKKSILYVRKQMKKKKNRPSQSIKNKQNYTRVLKTEHSQQCIENYMKRNLSNYHNQNNSDMLSQTPSSPYIYQDSKSLCNKNNITPGNSNSQAKQQKISTSRALQMFSKVYRNQGIQRVRIRRQVMVNKTTDVHVKQLVLQDKTYQEKKQNFKTSTQKGFKDTQRESSLKNGGNQQKIQIESQKRSQTTNNNTSKNCHEKNKKQPRKGKTKSEFYFDDDNFQLVGW